MSSQEYYARENRKAPGASQAVSFGCDTSADLRRDPGPTVTRDSSW